MIILFAFLVSSVYSMYQMILMEQGITLGEFQSHFSNNTLVLSTPVIVNNTGYYDITDFNLTTTLKDFNGTLLTTSSTLIGNIQKGSVKSRWHNLSLNSVKIPSNMTHLLFNDTQLKIDFSVAFRYAYALSFGLTVRNMSIARGTPPHGFVLRNVTLSGFNETPLLFQAFREFENPGSWDVIGNPHLEVYGESGEYIGSGVEA